MRNALTDLTRPAAPPELRVKARGRTLTLRIGRRPDPRVHVIVVLRHRGASRFDPDGPGVVHVCRATGSTCVDRGLQPGTYRYEAVAYDDWGKSLPKLSYPAVVRKVR